MYKIIEFPGGNSVKLDIFVVQAVMPSSEDILAVPGLSEPVRLAVELTIKTPLWSGTKIFGLLLESDTDRGAGRGVVTP